jgi:hypothetical protein
MERNEVAETAALAVALALVGAFMVSFATGLGRRSPRPASDAAAADAPSVDPGTDVRGRVEVLNASNQPGRARDATARLREAGYDVVHFGNAARVPDSSRVIDRIGRPDIARALADHLGIDRVITAIDSTLYLDASIILGVDWVPKR